MTARKLQGEIDRVLKRIQEGIVEFDETWEKVKEASTPNLKEKYEGDLKKEIKKLQRFRDQVKTWATSSEVKNKKPLLDARKAIETEMERFKVLERETKTKAYSKEGLSLSMKQKKDPTKDPNYPHYQWMEETKEQMEEERSNLEESLETLRSSAKSSKKNQNEIDTLTTRIERLTWHMDQLEDLENTLRSGEISRSRIEEIKDEVDYYMESGSDPDYYFDTAMYDVEDEDNPQSEDYVSRDVEEKEVEEDVDVPAVLKKRASKKDKDKESSPGSTSGPTSPTGTGEKKEKDKEKEKEKEEEEKEKEKEKEKEERRRKRKEECKDYCDYRHNRIGCVWGPIFVAFLVRYVKLH
eukprot:gb/GEZN01009901.1/.p1 GENE.gb/GEZN01009901.1/~~gb/GEZN01009901.1/.p1  ORF type:complete len:353 (-),score=92.47 gb/GEZN01009901.1/:115-1173(-)